MKDIIFQYAAIVLIAGSGVLTLISGIWGLYKTFRKKEQTNAWIISVVGVYLTALMGYQNQYQENFSIRFADLRDSVNKSQPYNIRVIQTSSEIDVMANIYQMINSKITEVLRFSRVFYVPGLNPEQTLNDDSILGRLFFAEAFGLDYIIGFPWNGEKPERSELQVEQFQMAQYLFEILLYHKWSDESNASTLLKKKRIFHLPFSFKHDYWSLVNKKNEVTAGIAYIGGNWSGRQSPIRERILLINDDAISRYIDNEIDDLQSKSVDHLNAEMNKENPWEKCICTVFCSDNAIEGLKPLKIDEIRDKYHLLEKQYQYNNTVVKKRPYIFELFENLISASDSK